MKKLLIVLVVMFPASAFAYVDPGTGAYVLQTILAVAGAVIFYIRNPIKLWGALREKMRSDKTKKTS